MIPSAASSRSALRSTIAGFLPPISTMHGRGQRVENVRNSSKPTSYEPVNTMPSMPGFVWSSSPTVSPGPITRLNTPSGTPASRYASAIATAVIADAEAGLNTTRVAGHHRGRRRPDGERHREVERADDREHAVRAEDRPGVDRGVAEVVHRVVVERVVLGRLRVVADEVRGLLDLAQRLEPGLADLDRHQPRVLHLALADELGGRLEDLEPPLPAEPEPRRLRPSRGRDRVLDVGAGALRERPDEDVGVDRRADLERAVAVALRAADDVAVDLAQPRLRPLQPCLVLLLQLLVVGTQGRVRDLDPLGGHLGGLSRAGASRGGAMRVRQDVAGHSTPGDPPKGPATHRTPGASPRVDRIPQT